MCLSTLNYYKSKLLQTIPNDIRSSMKNVLFDITSFKLPVIIDSSSQMFEFDLLSNENTNGYITFCARCS